MVSESRFFQLRGESSSSLASSGGCERAAVRHPSTGRYFGVEIRIAYFAAAGSTGTSSRAPSTVVTV